MKNFKWTGFIATLALLTSIVASPQVFAQDASFCGKTYTIKDGDTLSALAISAFGDVNGFLRFFENPTNSESLGENPNRISIGAQLELPPCGGNAVSNLEENTDTSSERKTDPFAQTIDVVTGSDFAPFTDENLEYGGMLTAMVQEAFEQSNLNQAAKIVFINDWGAQLETLLPEQKYDFSFPWYQPNCVDRAALSSAMRKRCDLVWSEPLFSVIIGFYGLASDTSVTANFTDLTDKHLCRPSGYFTFDLEEKGLRPGENIQLSQPNSPSDCFDLLANGEVDFVTINRFTAEKAIATAGLDGLIVPLSTIVTTQDLHLVGHQSNANAVRLITRFNAGLEELQSSGRLSRITNFFMNQHQQEVDQLRGY